jgi:hypothetical protein
MRSTETALHPALRRAALVLLAGARLVVVRAQEVVLPGLGGTFKGGEVPMFIPKEMPGPGFPGATAAESNAAWPSGRQPFNKGAWPQTGFRTPQRKYATCWKKTVLHDHERGWPGLCLKLFHTNITEERQCREVCANEPRCPVWQFVNQTDPDECWLGFGEDCLTRGGEHDAITVQGAQRIMHGEVRVLMNLKGWKVHRLTNIGVYSPTDEALNVMRCKAWCYSTLPCQYWQYGPTGCWVDNPLGHRGNPRKEVQYPLTISEDGAEQYTEEAVTMLYGEYIQHYCPPPDGTSPMAPLSSEILLGASHEGGTGSGTPFPPLWLLGLLVLGLISCLVAYLFHAKAAESSKGGSRRMRVADNGFDHDDY